MAKVEFHVKTQKGMVKVYGQKMSQKTFMKQNENYLGYCIKCGASRKHCEPDARRYPCDKCHGNFVYGLEELLLMNYVRLT